MRVCHVVMQANSLGSQAFNFTKAQVASTWAAVSTLIQSCHVSLFLIMNIVSTMGHVFAAATICPFTWMI